MEWAILPTSQTRKLRPSQLLGKRVVDFIAGNHPHLFEPKLPWLKSWTSITHNLPTKG